MRCLLFGMILRRNSLLSAAVLLFCAQISYAELSKGHQILIERGLQLQGMVLTYDTFSLNTYSNANYTSVNWTWDAPRSWNFMSNIGPAPGFPWSRWVGNLDDMPPMGGEEPYLSQLVALQLGDEAHLSDDNVRNQVVDWFVAVRDNWPTTILYVNNYLGQAPDGALHDFINRARPDMICFDNYPFEEDQNTGAPYALWTPWYSELRRYREHARVSNIPFATYRQTFQASERPVRVYRHPTRPEVWLNTFAALAFNAKMLIDFTYNNGSSSLFTPPGGDSNPTVLYTELADANFRARNMGKALVRLMPIINERRPGWTTTMMFIRGKDGAGNHTPVPIGFFTSGTEAHTDWVYQHNDPYLTSWGVTNTGTRNNGHPGDVIVSWFKPLDESFDGPDYTNQIYMMVVNGLTDVDPASTPAECAQEIKLNFHSSIGALEVLNPLTGVAELQLLPLVNGLRQLVLNLNGGDAALFKFATGAPFVGVDSAPVTGLPVVTLHPASRENILGTHATFTAQAYGSGLLSYQWQLDGADIPGATVNTFTRSNVQFSHAGAYTVVVSNSFGTVTSTPATLTVISAQPFFYEPFDYPNIGGPVSSNTPANWAHNTGTLTNDTHVTSGSLSYPGLAASIGNSVTNGGAGLGVRRLFGTNITSGTLYFSALFRMNAMGTDWNGAASSIGGLAQPDNNTFSLNILVRTNTGGATNTYVFGLQKPQPAGSQVFDSIPYTNGDTIFLVARYDFNTSPHTVSLWINPNPSEFGSIMPPPPTLTTSGGTDSTGLDRFNMRQNTAPSVPAAMQWDELRAGNSWGDVTPFSPPQAVLLTNVTRLGNGSVQFAFSSNSAQSGSVYASTNLIDWIFIGAPVQVEPGLYRFSDETASDHVQRFYQLRWP
jgi:hypothetical protein